jgi:hypothetical protein
MSKLNADQLLSKLLDNQRKNIDPNNLLEYKDLKRLTKYIDTSFFTIKCCIWDKIKNKNTKDKRANYITFYFRKKKVSLYRILYYNFVDDIGNNEFIRCMCKNRNYCCNVNHLAKFKYSKERYDIDKSENIEDSDKSESIEDPDKSESIEDPDKSESIEDSDKSESIEDPDDIEI